MNWTKNSGDRKPLVPVITGPTASGKTSIAIALADTCPNIEIISADSRQIYQDICIGTDKPDRELLTKYKFHLVDFIKPGERYTAFDFAHDSRKLLKEILERGSRPIICGGTGLYIRALIEGIVQIPEDDFSIRNQLEEEAITRGPKYLYEKLQEIDPTEAAKVHPNNIKKIIRALEIHSITGETKSDLIRQDISSEETYNFEISCLMPNRKLLYERINLRVDEMIKAGLLGEIKMLTKKGLKEAVKKINVIGYNELFRYCDNEIPLETAVNLIKQNSRRFAKRQITWFNGMKNVQFYDSAKKLIDYLKDTISN